jgi:hypothetical protein
MQTITTRYMPYTARLPSRIQAKATNGEQITVSTHSLPSEPSKWHPGSIDRLHRPCVGLPGPTLTSLQCATPAVQRPTPGR